ncbi:FAD-dependent oxidoreductase [Ornithinimicrobium sp. LYQ121]|uniref:FAD-dependent oxidoreductase n=1 Tax=Ornithinimicrobium sp. LYQ121 TaxID=3378801 RepID=UPI003851D942
MAGGHRVPRPRRVFVVGASLAGMFAAAACTGAGHAVTVLERDVLPSAPRPRPGVPQGRQPHVLLYRGLLALEELLPGLGEDLREAGAVDLDTGDLAWLGEAGWSPYRSRQFRILSVTRPLLEHLVLERVRQLPRLAVFDASRVVSVSRGRDSPWQVATDDGSVHDADLVIDASGRGSRLPAWLAGAGVGPVAVSDVDARTGYATREYAVRPGRVGPAGVVVLQTPTTRAGGLALPVEGGRWLVTAVGSGEHRPPRDADGFESFLQALCDPAVAEVVGGSWPLSDVAVHRQTANRRLHYERLRPWPSGLLVVGDAFCAFNPVYGQGIAVAACEALLLRRTLERGLRPGTERRLLRDFARLTALPWGIATSEDLRMPTSDSAPTAVQSLTGRWVREVARLSAHGDERAQWAMTRVYHLMASPRVLMHPALVMAAVRAHVSGYGPLNPRPQITVPPTAAPGPPRP